MTQSWRISPKIIRNTLTALVSVDRGTNKAKALGMVNSIYFIYHAYLLRLTHFTRNFRTGSCIGFALR